MKNFSNLEEELHNQLEDFIRRLQYAQGMLVQIHITGNARLAEKALNWLYAEEAKNSASQLASMLDGKDEQ